MNLSKSFSVFNIIFALFLCFSACDGPTETMNVSGEVPSDWYLFPTWSPTGEWIAYEHYAIDSLFGIWLVRPDGSENHFETRGILPDFSPDGKKLALVRSSKIFIYNLETRERTQLTFNDSNFFPCWSPDSKKIAYDSNFLDPKRAHVIWTMDSDGQNKKDISQHGVGEWREPDWFPDFRILHKRYGRGRGAGDLFIMDSTGTKEIQLTSIGRENRNGKVSPDGNRIVWERWEVGHAPAIWLMNSDGSSQKRLTDGYEPDWAPDSRHIIFRKLGEYVGGEPWDDADPKVHGSVWIMDVNKRKQWQFLPPD